jgi:hypothetical protein
VAYDEGGERREERKKCSPGAATAIGFVMAFHHECWCEAFMMFDGPKRRAHYQDAVDGLIFSIVWMKCGITE